MISEIIREVLALENIDEATNESVLLWAQRVDAKKAQREVFDIIKEAKDFDSMRQNIKKNMTM